MKKKTKMRKGSVKLGKKMKRGVKEARSPVKSKVFSRSQRKDQAEAGAVAHPQAAPTKSLRKVVLPEIVQRPIMPEPKMTPLERTVHIAMKTLRKHPHVAAAFVLAVSFSQILRLLFTHTSHQNNKRGL